MTIQAKMTMPDFQRYYLKLWLIKYELDIHVFVILKACMRKGYRCELGMSLFKLKSLKITLTVP